MKSSRHPAFRAAGRVNHRTSRGACAHRLLLFLSAGVSLAAVACLNTTSSAQKAGDSPPRTGFSSADVAYADPSTLDPAIPTPQAVLGHEPGTGAVRYDALIRYFTLLSEASPLATLTPYAKSHEGRTLYFLTITSEANHAKLDAIRAENDYLADPRLINRPQEAERILDALPGIAWLAYSIHGDELSSTDAAVYVAYRLVAGRDDFIRNLRNELVIHIDPLQNPDGRERYLNQLQHLTGRVPNTDDQALQHTGLWSVGRGNHYLFDLNRDWLMMVHPETRGRAAQILKWNPHLLVDSHEMGSLDTYLFDPPREPFNPNLSNRNLQWRRKFSADQARAFDRHGWSYYTGDWYEEWYPGYTNAWANLLGAVGILYEQAGVNAAAVRQQAGNVLTYRETVHHHVVGSFANLESLRANRREVLADYFRDRRWSVGLADDGEPQVVERSVFLVAPTPDGSRFRRFGEALSRQGIEWGLAADPVTATKVTDIWGEVSAARTLPAGTMVVRLFQPHRRLLHALFEFDPRMSESFLKQERTELESQRGSKIYDVTGWNPAMAAGLEAYWAGSIGDVSIRTPAPPTRPIDLAPAGYGYLIHGADDDVYRLLVRLLERDVKVRVAEKPFRIEGHDYPRGSVLLRNSESDVDLPAVVANASQGLFPTIRGVSGALSESGPDLGTNGRFPLLHAPRVAIAAEWPIITTSFGFVWHLLDCRLELRSSPINIQFFPQIDLRKYNVLILPSGQGGGAMAGVLPPEALTRLKSWVESGGTLIAIGNSAAFLAAKDRGFSAVRLREDVLEELPAYEEALQQERAARNVRINLEEVWGAGPAGNPGFPAAPAEASPSVSEPAEKNAKAEGPKPSGTGDMEAIKRLDAWQRLFRPTGVIAAAEFDPEHWLTFGLDIKEDDATGYLPVLISGSHAYMSRRPVRTPVRLVDDRPIAANAGEGTGRRLRLSGLLWPEARERWRNTAFATVERVGAGQIILFASDPAFRGYFDGSTRLLMNAVILGPGLGTQQPVPW